MITKEQTLLKLRDYINGISETYHKNYANTVTGAMYGIKKLGNLDNQDLSLLLGIPVETIEKMLKYGWDGHISTKLLIKIYILSLGTLTIPGCELDKKEKSIIENFYQDTITASVPNESEQTDESTDDEIIIDFSDLQYVNALKSVVGMIMSSPKFKTILDKITPPSYDNTSAVIKEPIEKHPNNCGSKCNKKEECEHRNEIYLDQKILKTLSGIRDFLIDFCNN